MCTCVQCVCVSGWRAANPRSLGSEGPKDKPHLLLAQKENKHLEIVCKWRRNQKSQGTKEGCWKLGGGKGGTARGMTRG